MIFNDQTISGQDGRKLRFSEAGQPDGMPVLVHHGTPGSRLLSHPLIEDAKSRGIRLISYDRPGYGGSTSQPGRSVASAVDDVAAIAKHLKIDRLCVWGASGGGPHALACAALLPDLVAAAAAIASLAPYLADGLDWLVGMGEDNIEEYGAALDGRDSLNQYIEVHAPGLLSATPEGPIEALRSLLSPVDIAVVTGDFADRMIKNMSEAITNSRDGWIDDDIAAITPWGFKLSSIRIPVLLMHGAQDQFVPFSHGEWLASHISNAHTRLSADDGHLSLTVSGIPEVHAWLLDKMS